MTSVSAANVNGYAYTASASSQAAKTTSAQTTNSDAAKQNSSPDVLTISAEGLEALEKIENAEIYEPKQYLDLNTFKKPELRSITEAYEQNSNHLSPIGWALGVTNKESPLYKANSFLQSEEGVLAMRSQLQANREKIDGKISDLLESNNITLNKNETLNINVNHLGEITVGDGLSSDKKEKVEKLLNEDVTLAQDLLFTHAERKFAVMGDNSAFHEKDDAEYYIITDTILRREYGVSLDDFQKNIDKNGGWNGSIVAKEGENQDSNNAVLEKIRGEERSLYTYIKNALNHLEENGGEFEVSYAYKNGVTIEKGATDESTLSEVSSAFTPMVKYNMRGGLQATVMIDPSGMVVDSSITSVDDRKDSLYVSNALQGFFNKVNGTSLRNNSNIIPTQSRLQQFAFDSQRLFQFNTGMNAEAIKAMNVTFTTGG